MPNGPQTFMSPRSLAKMARIVDYVSRNDGVTRDEVAIFARICPQRAGGYLRFAADEMGLIHRKKRPKRIGSRGVSSIKWVAGPAPVPPRPRKARAEKAMPTIAKQTQVHIARDPMTAALFGPAQQRNEQ